MSNTTKTESGEQISEAELLRLWKQRPEVHAQVLEMLRLGAPVIGKRRRLGRPTSPAARKYNRKKHREKLRGLLLENFSEPGSMESRLHFNRSVTPQEARAAIQKVTRLLRHEYRAEGKEARYLYFLEQDARSGAWYIHLYLSPGISPQRAGQMWTEGEAYTAAPQLQEPELSALLETWSENPEHRRGYSQNLRRTVKN